MTVLPWTNRGLLASGKRRGTTILRGADAKRLENPDSGFSSRPLYPLTEKPQADFYELYFTGHSGEDAQPHEPGTRENLVITPGRLEVDEDGVRHELTKGDAIIFGADVPHAYINSGSEPCWAYLVMTYVAAQGAPPDA